MANLEEIKKASSAVLALAIAAMLAVAVPVAPAMADEGLAAASVATDATQNQAEKPKLKVTVAKKVKYTGKKAAPKVTVKSGGKKLVAKRDYTVTYLDSKKRKTTAKKVRKPGTYYVRVSGKGAYKGATKTARFKVYSKNGQRWVTKYKKVEVTVKKTVVDRKEQVKYVPVFGSANLGFFNTVENSSEKALQKFPPL